MKQKFQNEWEKLRQNKKKDEKEQDKLVAFLEVSLIFDEKACKIKLYSKDKKVIDWVKKIINLKGEDQKVQKKKEKKGRKEGRDQNLQGLTFEISRKKETLHRVMILLCENGRLPSTKEKLKSFLKVFKEKYQIKAKKQVPEYLEEIEKELTPQRSRRAKVSEKRYPSGGSAKYWKKVDLKDSQFSGIIEKKGHFIAKTLKKKKRLKFTLTQDKKDKKEVLYFIEKALTPNPSRRARDHFNKMKKPLEEKVTPSGDKLIFISKLDKKGDKKKDQEGIIDRFTLRVGKKNRILKIEEEFFQENDRKPIGKENSKIYIILDYLQKNPSQRSNREQIFHKSFFDSFLIRKSTKNQKLEDFFTDFINKKPEGVNKKPERVREGVKEKENQKEEIKQEKNYQLLSKLIKAEFGSNEENPLNEKINKELPLAISQDIIEGEDILFIKEILFNEEQMDFEGKKILEATKNQKKRKEIPSKNEKGRNPSSLFKFRPLFLI